MVRTETLRAAVADVYRHLKRARATMDRRANPVSWSEIDVAITTLEELGIDLERPAAAVQLPEHAQPPKPLKA